MNGGDKILDRIKADCDESIKEINAKAEEARSRILSDGKAKADAIALEIQKKADSEVKRINASSDSRAELEIRNSLLKRRRIEIDITVQKILDYLLNLDGTEYFDVIYKLSSRLKGKEGEISLNAKDLKRLPSDFEKKLFDNGVKATVAKTPADISGGFILRCGDIEENMDFTALLNEKSGEIEDLINRELFAQ